MSYTKTALAAAIAFAIGSTALAQQGSRNESSQAESSQSRNAHGEYRSFQRSDSGRAASEEMGRMDRNRDERIDQSEAESDPQLIAAWADVDVTQDGAIDATEYYLYAATTRIAELEGGQSQQSRQGQSSSRQSSGDARQFGQSQGEQDSRQAGRSSQQGQSGSGSAGGDRSASEHSTSDGAGSNRSASERSTSDSAGSNRSASERSTSNRADADRSASDRGRSESVSGERSERSQGQDGRTGQSREGGMPSFDEIDQDSGGYVTREEFNDIVADAEFGRADANRDGWISRSEYQAAYRQRDTQRLPGSAD